MTSSTSQNTASPRGATPDTSLEQQVRARIRNLSYLPTTVAVALKFIELGKDPEVEPSEYVKVIGSDSSLSTKLLSLANSSWFGVRNRVTKIPVAVNLLGLGTVRTLAISYCVTGLHNELKLSAEESKKFWISSLCKAVAAKQFAALHDVKLGEEAFAAGLFQDFALTVMYSTARAQFLPVLEDPACDAKARLHRERELFRLDHAELGRCIAQKLELPDLFVDAIAFHHNHATLRDLIEKPALADAVYFASLFPHWPDIWSANDADELREFYLAHGSPSGTAEALLDSIQKEFNQLYAYFEQGEPPETRLASLLAEATREVSDNTTRLVGQVQEMMQQAVNGGKRVTDMLPRNQDPTAPELRDVQSGALNPDAFGDRAAEALAMANRYGLSFAIAELGLDNFKPLVAALSKEAADTLIDTIIEAARRQMRDNDVLARFEADRFVLLLPDCTEPDALQIARRIVEDVAAGGQVTISAGVLFVRSATQPLGKLLAAAQALTGKSRSAGGNRVTSAVFTGAAAA